MKRKILCVLFASLMLLSVFPLGVFATNSATKNEWKDLSKTTIEYDFEFVYANEYVIEHFKEDKEKTDVGLISVMQGYNKELNCCDLFLYVYNPSRKQIAKKSDGNNLQLSVYNSNNDSCKNEYFKKELELVDESGNTLEDDIYTNALVLKFRLPGACDGQPGSVTQCYNLVEVELSIDGEINAFLIGKTAKFTYTSVGDTDYRYLVCETATLDVLETDVYHTYYRVNTEGINQYQDIQSVYFSIPNSLINAYGNLWSMHCIWNTHQTNNVLVTSDSALQQKFESWMYGYNPYSKNFDYSVVYGDIAFSSSRYPYAYNAEKMSDYICFFSSLNAGWYGLEEYDYDEEELFGGDFGAPSYSVYDYPLTMVFKSDNIDSYEEKVVDGEDILQYIYGHKIFEDGQWVWNDSLFSISSSNETTFTVNRKLADITVYEKCGGWGAFWMGQYFDWETDENITIDTFMEIDENDVLHMSKEEFSKKYLINEEDFRCESSVCGECLQCRVTEEKDDCTWFMLRYDITDFQAYNALICDNKNGTTEKACIFNCGVIEGFDTLSIQFEGIDSKGKTVLNTFPIGRAPSDFAVDGFTPEYTPKLDEIIKNNLGINFDWLVFGLKVALIVIAALIVIRVVAPLIPKRTKIKITQGKERRRK